MDTEVEARCEQENIISPEFLVGTFFYSGVVANLAILLCAALAPFPYKEHFFFYGLPIVFLILAGLAAKATRTRGAFTVFARTSLAAVLRSFLSLAALIFALRVVWWIYLKAFAPYLLDAISPLAFYWKWEGWSHGAIRSIVGSPISEEILFRGWLQNWLAGKDSRSAAWGRFSISRANLVCSLAFTLAHLTATGPLYGLRLFGVFCGSLVFGAARERTNGLAMPIVLHALANLFGDYI